MKPTSAAKGRDFLDTNIVLYLLSADTAKADRAEGLLLRRPSEPDARRFIPKT